MLAASLTNTLSPISTCRPGETRPMPSLWLCLLRSLAACLSSKASRTSRKACCWSGTKASNLPLYSTPSTTGLIGSNCVRASRPNSRRNGVGDEGKLGSGVRRWIQHAGSTCRSHILGQDLQSSGNTSWSHFPPFRPPPGHGGDWRDRSLSTLSVAGTNVSLSAL